MGVFIFNQQHLKSKKNNKMLSSKIIALFFLVPVFVLIGYVIYLLIVLTGSEKSNINSSLTYVWKLYFKKNDLVVELVDRILQGVNMNNNDPNKFENDPISSKLDEDAHTSALNTYCSTKPGLKMDPLAQACVYATKEACEAKSLKTQDAGTILKGNGKFLTWQDEDSLGCISSFGNAGACEKIGCPSIVRPCTAKEYKEKYKDGLKDYNKYKKDNNLGKDFQYSDYLESKPIECKDLVSDSPLCTQQPYVPPIIKCDSDGYCYTKQKNDYGKCKLIPEYCASKGVSYSSTGLGTCYESDVQGVAEAIVGKTFTRFYRKSYQDMVNACSNKAPHDQTCGKALASLAVLPEEIFIDSVKAEYVQTAASIKSNCRINQPDPSTLPADKRPPPMDGPRAMQCLKSVVDLWPGFFVLDKVNGLVNHLIRLIPGGQDFPGVDMFGIQSMIEFGGKALDAVFQFGKDAGKAFQEAGKDMVDAYQKLMKGGSLIDFAVEEAVALLKLAADVLEDCGKLALSVVKAGVEAMESVVKYGLQGLEIIFNGIKQGINALGTYLGNKMNTCGKGVTLQQCFDEKDGPILGALFGAAASLFLTSLKVFAWFAGVFGDFFKYVAEGIKDFFCFFCFC